ncbi:MAG: V-type ATP synthase subunit E [Candidatus Omnitrophota bacterium]
MEMELKNIIDKIKTEGVSEAEKQAAGITSQAEAKAKSIVEAAQKEKDAIIKEAGQAAEKMQKNGEEAIKQASRDVLLGLRQSIVGLYDTVIKRDVSEQLSPDVLKGMISQLTESITKNKKFDVEVLLSEKDKKQLEEMLLSGLKKELKKSVDIKASPNVEHGFRIGEKDGSSYYDFTDEAIAEAFKAYLNPKIAQILMSGTENAK